MLTQAPREHFCGKIEREPRCGCMTTRSLTRALCLALALPACALDQPSDDPSAVPDDTLPDGTTGVDRIHHGAQTMMVPWVARDGG